MNDSAAAGPPRPAAGRRSFLAGLAAVMARPHLAHADGVRADAGRAGGMDLRVAMDAIRCRADVPALAALSFCGAGVLEEAVTGSRRRGVPEAVVTPQDVFHVGSITKSMTAVVAASMVEAGVISWTTAVGEVLGGLPLHDDVKPVTLWQLLRHRSGLRRDLPGDLQERLGREGRSLMEQRRGLARVMLAEPLEQPPENGYGYSNAGYTMAGLMLETVAGQAWEELVAARVFLPLGLTSAGFGAPARTPTVTNQPWGHRADGSVVEPGPGDDNGPAMGPAGTVHLSLPDLANYARWHLREATPSPPLVTAASLARLHGVGQPDGYYGGWDRVARDWARGQALTHTGTNTLFFAAVWLAPARDFGVLAVSNQGGSVAAQACDSACAHLIQRRA